MMHVNMKLLAISEKILACVKPGTENDPDMVAVRESCEGLRVQVAEDMREWLEILEECIPEVTEAPWCGFSDDDKVWAVMAAGRPGDVFKFEEPPKEADAHYLLLAQPHYVQAMLDRIRHLETLANVEDRWTSVSAEKVK